MTLNVNELLDDEGDVEGHTTSLNVNELLDDEGDVEE
jgi:hypothetical protein